MIIQKAAATAESVWKCGQIKEDQRKAYAVNPINSSLLMEGIRIDDDVSKAVSLAVDMSVKLFLPKSHEIITAENVPATTTTQA